MHSLMCTYVSLLSTISCLIISTLLLYIFFFFNDPPTTEIYTLSLHDALPIWCRRPDRASPPHGRRASRRRPGGGVTHDRSEEHTSELQSRVDLVCRLLLEKKKKETQYENNLQTRSCSDLPLHRYSSNRTNSV